MAKRKPAPKKEPEAPMQVEWVEVKLPIYKGEVDVLNPVMDRIDCRIADLKYKEAFKRVQRALWMLNENPDQQINITHTANEILSAIAKAM